MYDMFLDNSSSVSLEYTVFTDVSCPLTSIVTCVLLIFISVIICNIFLLTRCTSLPFLYCNYCRRLLWVPFESLTGERSVISVVNKPIHISYTLLVLRGTTFTTKDFPSCNKKFYVYTLWVWFKNVVYEISSLRTHNVSKLLKIFTVVSKTKRI